MKNVLQEYVPFEHSDLEYINNLINFARQQKSNNTAESVITSAVIYINLVEYLVKHLLINFMHMIYLTSYLQFSGILFLKDSSNRIDPFTLGQLKKEISYYEFPDKIDFLKLLDKFIGSRNSLLHRMMFKKTKEDFDQLDKDIVDIQNGAEEILQKYNIITGGIANVWQKLVTPLSKDQDKTK